MKKSKFIGRVFGIALAAVLIGATLGGLSGEAVHATDSKPSPSSAPALATTENEGDSPAQSALSTIYFTIDDPGGGDQPSMTYTHIETYTTTDSCKLQVCLQDVGANPNPEPPSWADDIANVYVDGVLIGTYDSVHNRLPYPGPGPVQCFTSDLLAADMHTVTVELVYSYVSGSMFAAEITAASTDIIPPAAVSDLHATAVDLTSTGFVYPTGRGPTLGNGKGVSYDYADEPDAWDYYGGLYTYAGWLANGERGHYLPDKYHIGVDIDANKDDPVYAIADGEIVRVSTGIAWGTGNFGIFIRHKLSNGDTFLALYGHVVPDDVNLRYASTKDVEPPVAIKAGERFARIGDYGSADHLHFGILLPTAPTDTGEVPIVDDKVNPRNNKGNGMMGLNHWPTNTNGFVDPIKWITTQTPESPHGPATIVLHWTAPANDGNDIGSGPSAQYDIRYSTRPIETDEEWESASQGTGEPQPGDPGVMDSFAVTRLFPATAYHFALKAYDEAGNPSGLSNVVWEITVGIQWYLCSPADMIVTDPDDLTISKDLNELPEATYTETDINGDGDADDVVAIPHRKIGDYLIHVIPEAGASPTDTYTLGVTAGGVTIVLAENVRIADIPVEGYLVRSTETEIVQVVPATIDFDPDTFNVKAMAKYVTAHIELPLGYDVRQIDVSSIRLNRTVPALTKPAAIGDYDGDGIPDLMVKFDTAAVKAILTPGAQVEVTITGEVAGIAFEGNDTISVIDPTWYSLGISTTSGGSVAVPGEGTFSCKGGTVVNLVAIPDPGYRFVGWTGDVGTIGNADAASTTITVNGNYFVTANFEHTTRIWQVDDDLADYPDADFTRIQDAVDAASPGDTIIVYPGTYTENVDVNKDYLTVQSQSGAETAIIQGTAPGEYIVKISADHVSIDGFSVTGSGSSWEASLYIAGASYCTVSNNDLHASAWYGILLTDSHSNLIQENGVWNHYDNIALAGSTDNTITTNEFADGVYFGVVLCESSNGNTLSGNTFLNDGLWVADSYSNAVDGNTVNGKPLVYLEGRSDDVVADAGQVILVSCTNITVDSLDLSNTSVGIELWQTSSSRIANNLVGGCHRYGIYVGYYSTSNHISHNHFSAYTGIDLFVSDNNTITDNNVSNCCYNIGLWGCVGNAIYLNNFNPYVYGGAGDTGAANTWNSPEPITYRYKGSTFTNYLGNYWSDYEDRYPDAGEIDSTGIWDTSYGIDPNADNYPLVAPFESYVVGPRTWYVDDDLADYPDADFTGIQDAVDAANPGDTIVVYPGTYTENVDVNKDCLTIQSQSGAEATIAQAANPDDHVFDVQADYMKIGGFTAKGATGWECCGIYVADGADYCEIWSNRVSDNCFGIKLFLSSNNLVANNEISSNWCQGIYLDFSRNNEISANTLVNNGIFIFGYEIPDFNTHMIEGNTVNGEPIYYFKDESGVDVPSDAGEVILANCLDMTVKDLDASFGSVGIELAYTNGCEVVSNNVSNSGSGIVSYYSRNNRITDNSLSDNTYCGIYMFASSDNTLENNTALRNDCGIVLWNSANNNTVIHNIASDNSFLGMSLEDRSNDNLIMNNILLGNGWGIRLWDSHHNRILENVASHNAYGIHLDYSSDNEIYLNDFVDNTQSAYSYESSNSWHSLNEVTYTYYGSTFRNYLGNYWSDYAGSDADGDGIGELPYPIDSDADSFPLVEPFEHYVPVS